MKKCGYVGVIGKTNAGKSTLINALVGEKVAIVSPKTQTTRKNILGILTNENTQIIFVDTPGIHKSQNNLDKQMMKSVRSASEGVDIVLYLLDASKKIDKIELDYLEKLSEKPLIVGISKVDLVQKQSLLPILNEVGKIKNIKAIIPFSSKNNTNLDAIKSEILENLPTKDFEFDEDMYTDSTVRFMCEEIVREKCLFLLNEELPHGIAVQIIKFEENQNIINIDADIICEKDSHKAIILGKNGLKTKEIATQSRKDMEELLQKKVFLKIWIKVVKNWRQNKIDVV